MGAPSTSDWLRRLPIREGVTQLRLTPSHERWLLRFLTESDYTDFWRQPGLAPGRYVDRFPDADVLLMGRERGSLVAVNTVHHDAAHPSRVVLPVIPGADVPGRAVGGVDG